MQSTQLSTATRLRADDGHAAATDANDNARDPAGATGGESGKPQQYLLRTSVPGATLVLLTGLMLYSAGTTTRPAGDQSPQVQEIQEVQLERPPPSDTLPRNAQAPKLAAALEVRVDDADDVEVAIAGREATDVAGSATPADRLSAPAVFGINPLRPDIPDRLQHSPPQRQFGSIADRQPASVPSRSLAAGKPINHSMFSTSGLDD